MLSQPPRLELSDPNPTAAFAEAQWKPTAPSGRPVAVGGVNARPDLGTGKLLRKSQAAPRAQPGVVLALTGQRQISPSLPASQLCIMGGISADR